MWFIYKFPPYVHEWKCRRDMGEWELLERGIIAPRAPVRAQGDGWVDAGGSGRGNTGREFTPKEGGVRDWVASRR